MATPPISHWSADFETTTDIDDCRVWHWGVHGIGNTIFNWGIDLHSFVKHVSRMTAHVYFHNLGFDGSFIVDWLFRNGYSHVDKYPRKGEFETVIDNTGKWYSITVKWMNGNRTQFRDSFKKIPMSVSKAAKAFGTPEMKLAIDYHKHRPIGYQPTAEEIEYLRSDCAIIANALDQQFNQGMTKLTVGSDSLAEFKRLFGSKYFMRTFPLVDKLQDDDIRKAYRGGFTYVNPKYQGRVIEQTGMVFDVNSLYPYIMRERVLPWGDPVWCESFVETCDEFPLSIQSVTFTAKLRPDHIPCIQVKGSPHFSATMYQTEISEPVTLFCTNVDLALWQDHYEMDILSYNGGYKFHGTRGLFDQFVDKWSDIKAKSDGGLKTIAKLFLNSLYGKFATNPDVTGKVPVFRDNTVKLVQGPEEFRDPVYTAMGVFITAYARDLTIRAGQDHYGVFAYADTDSLHLVVDEFPTDLNIHPTKLGAWKHELTFESALFARAKCYTEFADGKYNTHIAGLPETIADRVTYDDFLQGTVFTGKLMPKRVPGGIVLEETTFALKLDEISSTLC